MKKTFLIILSLPMWCIAGQAAVITWEQEMEQKELVGQAILKRDNGDYKGAIRLLDKAEKIDPYYALVYICRMESYDMLGETEKAIDDVMKLLFETECLTRYGVDEILKKDLDYSLKEAKKYSAKTHNSTIYRELLITIYVWKNDYENAIKEFYNMEKDLWVSEYFLETDICKKLKEYAISVSDSIKSIEVIE